MTPGHILVPLLAVAAVLPFVPPAAALVTGVAVALALGNPWLTRTRKLASLLLGIAVMGLGAAADLGVVGRVGLRGIGYTAVGISLTILAGLLLARVFAVEEDT
ncbi:MAG: putative sulfate exporter family transporter, partial [Thermoanaerobaculia bacterium]